MIRRGQYVLWGARSADVQIGSPEYVRHHERLVQLAHMQQIIAAYRQAVTQAFGEFGRVMDQRMKPVARQLAELARDLNEYLPHA